jgi:hypothetical protein
MVQVNHIQVEGVQNIIAVVFDHFIEHFKFIRVVRPGVDDLNFCRLTYTDEGNLIRPFIGGGEAGSVGLQ